MIIELAGLPGAGKTTKAQSLSKEHGLPIITAPQGKLALFVQGFLGMLARPLAADALFTLCLREPNPAVRRSLLINAWLGSSAKYWRARHGGIVDQGYAQAAIATLATEAEAPLVARVLRGIPQGTRMVWCEEGADVRAARIASRTHAPRAEFGEAAAARFAAESERAYHLVKGNMPGAHSQSGIHAFLKLFGFLLAYGVRLVARLFVRRPEALVLMYHAVDRSGWKISVTPEAFEQQMAYLARQGWVVPLSAVVAYAKSGAPLPRRAVALTFDDGYSDLLETVLPILERYKLPATVFVPTDISAPTSRNNSRPRLDWPEIRALAASGLVSIESHARTHRRLTELGVEEVRAEVAGSAEDIKREVGAPTKFFGFPYGARSKDAEHAVVDAGYEAAFGITDGTVRPGGNLFALPRVQIDTTMSFSLFKLRLSSAVDWNRRIISLLRA